MKSYEETIQSVLRKRDEEEAKSRKRNDAIKKTLIPLSFALVIAAAAFGVFFHGGFFPKKAPESDLTISLISAIDESESSENTAVESSSRPASSSSTEQSNSPTGVVTSASPEPISSVSFVKESEETAKFEEEKTSSTTFEAESTSEWNTELNGELAKMYNIDLNTLTQIFNENEKLFERVAKAVVVHPESSFYLNEAELVAEGFKPSKSEESDIREALVILNKYNDNCDIYNYINQFNVCFSCNKEYLGQWCTIGLLYLDPAHSYIDIGGEHNKIAENWYTFVVFLV